MRLSRPSASPRVQIVPATLKHLDAIERLRRADARSLGFFSRSTLAEKIELAQVRVAIMGRVIGCLIHGSLRGPEIRIFLLAVDHAWRGRGIGRLLVRDLMAHVQKIRAEGISLRCRENLASNAFWHAAGFDLHDLEPGRSGALFVWTRRTKRTRSAHTSLPHAASATFHFHSRWHACPRCGRWTCDTWTAGARRSKTCARCTAADLRT